MKFLNPVKIMGIWILMVIVTNCIVVPILYYNTIGGEQRPLTFLMKSIEVTFYGLFYLSIITGLAFFNWFKKFWYVNVIFFLISAAYLLQNIHNTDENYSFNEEVETINGFELKKRKDYYSLLPEKVKSIRFWKNNKRDSIWIFYAKDGTIMLQEKYRNDTLVK